MKHTVLGLTLTLLLSSGTPARAHNGDQADAQTPLSVKIYLEDSEDSFVNVVLGLFGFGVV